MTNKRKYSYAFSVLCTLSVQLSSVFTNFAFKSVTMMMIMIATLEVLNTHILLTSTNIYSTLIMSSP
jgi:hypothetical protein